MSIQTIQAYKVGEKMFHDLTLAKMEALASMLEMGTDDTSILRQVVTKTDEVISILQWNGESAPAKKTRKTRKDKGTKRSEVKPAVVSGSGKYEGK